MHSLLVRLARAALAPLALFAGFGGQFCWCDHEHHQAQGPEEGVEHEEHAASEPDRSGHDHCAVPGGAGHEPAAPEGCRCVRVETGAAVKPEPGRLPGASYRVQLALQALAEPALATDARESARTQFPCGPPGREHSPPLFLKHRNLRC